MGVGGVWVWQCMCVCVCINASLQCEQRKYDMLSLVM